ncbi:RNA polymerase sigma factor [Sorangium sp. So ce1014]|uniref:RNA polymerase sigma factor n=1 Tax=Sorangium sp. So ce1014 TaxID=3133326 RepID=UPI003F62ED69
MLLLHPAPSAQDRDSSVHRSAPPSHRRGTRRYPSTYPTVEELAALGPQLRHVLARYGVPRQDMADILQEVLLGAWTSIGKGRYRPQPGADPQTALASWLFGVLWRHVAHFHERAFRRREIAVADPWMAVPEPVLEHDPGDRIDAFDAILAICGLPPTLREVLGLAAVGAGPTEIAGILGLPVGTAASRLRRGRQLFVEMLARGRR